MHALITGGAGRIGAHMARSLIMHGHRVRVLDTFDEQIHGEHGRFPAVLPRTVERMRGDVRHAVHVTRAIDGVDVVLHFATAPKGGSAMLELQRCSDVNVTGTATLLEGLIRRRQPPACAPGALDLRARHAPARHGARQRRRPGEPFGVELLRTFDLFGKAEGQTP